MSQPTPALLSADQSGRVGQEYWTAADVAKYLGCARGSAYRTMYRAKAAGGELLQEQGLRVRRCDLLAYLETRRL